MTFYRSICDKRTSKQYNERITLLYVHVFCRFITSNSSNSSNSKKNIQEVIVCFMCHYQRTFILFACFAFLSSAFPLPNIFCSTFCAFVVDVVLLLFLHGWRFFLASPLINSYVKHFIRNGFESAHLFTTLVFGFKQLQRICKVVQHWLPLICSTKHWKFATQFFDSQQFNPKYMEFLW